MILSSVAVADVVLFTFPVKFEIYTDNLGSILSTVLLRYTYKIIYVCLLVSHVGIPPIMALMF